MRTRWLILLALPFLGSCGDGAHPESPHDQGEAADSKDARAQDGAGDVGPIKLDKPGEQNDASQAERAAWKNLIECLWQQSGGRNDQGFIEILHALDELDLTPRQDRYLELIILQAAREGDQWATRRMLEVRESPLAPTAWEWTRCAMLLSKQDGRMHLEEETGRLEDELLRMVRKGDPFLGEMAQLSRLPGVENVYIERLKSSALPLTWDNVNDLLIGLEVLEREEFEDSTLAWAWKHREALREGRADALLAALEGTREHAEVVFGAAKYLESVQHASAGSVRLLLEFENRGVNRKGGVNRWSKGELELPARFAADRLVCIDEGDLGEHLDPVGMAKIIEDAAGNGEDRVVLYAQWRQHAQKTPEFLDGHMLGRPDPELTKDLVSVIRATEQFQRARSFSEELKTVYLSLFPLDDFKGGKRSSRLSPEEMELFPSNWIAGNKLSEEELNRWWKEEREGFLIDSIKGERTDVEQLLNGMLLAAAWERHHKGQEDEYRKWIAAVLMSLHTDRPEWWAAYELWTEEEPKADGISRHVQEAAKLAGFAWKK